MGVVKDLKDALGDVMEKFAKNALSSGVKSNFHNISDILDKTYSSSTKEDGFMSQFVTVHPASFTGAATSDGTSIWSIIESLCNNVIVPIAGFILTIILVYDLMQMVMNGNNFKDFDSSIFMRWIIKAMCGVLLVANTYYIASGLFAFGTNVCANGIEYLVDGELEEVDEDAFDEAIDDYDVGELLIMMLLSFVILLIVFALTIVIILILASRMIEIFMYLGVSPIPMATMMNNEWGTIGKNWIKGVLSLSFQGFFIIIALGIFQAIFNNVIAGITSMSDGVCMSLLMLAGYSAALIFTILRSGQISRSIFNAS